EVEHQVRVEVPDLAVEVGDGATLHRRAYERAGQERHGQVGVVALERVGGDGRQLEVLRVGVVHAARAVAHVDAQVRGDAAADGVVGVHGVALEVHVDGPAQCRQVHGGGDEPEGVRQGAGRLDDAEEAERVDAHDVGQREGPGAGERQRQALQVNVATH